MSRRVQNRFALTVLLVFVFLLAACGTVGQLNKTKKHWQAQDYQWIAGQEISCKPSEEGCNQLHLLKGDACFRLAKQDVEPLAHYQCSAKHLNLGIQQTSDWQLKELDLNRAQTYENLCESLRQWQDLERGQRARQVAGLLLQTAEEFLAAEPGNLAAIYFLSSARYTMLQPELLDPSDPQTLCRQLKGILEAVEANEPRAQGTRYGANYNRLRLDVSGARQAVPGCN